MKRVIDVPSIEDILQTDKVILRSGSFSGSFEHIVYCRDCKYRETDGCPWDRGGIPCREEDGFCSIGEHNG